MRALTLGVGLAVAIVCAPCLGHERPISYSTWRIDGSHAQVTLRMSSLEASRLPQTALPERERDEQLGRYFRGNLVLRADGVACPVSDGPRPLQAPVGRIAYEWEIRCPTSHDMQIESDLFLDVAPSHLHFARVHLSGDEPAQEKVLSDDERVWSLTASADIGGAGGTSFGEYVELGILHILTGYDHLAFLVALLLLGGSLLDVARIVTGFTVAHSITLAVSVLGYLRPETRPIEALIGLSIALVAAENLWLVGGRSRMQGVGICAAVILLATLAAAGYGGVPALSLAGLALFTACYFALVDRVSRRVPLRAAVAFVFGLVHGFGFAGVLMEVQLPTDRLAAALLGFNLGVELGQLAAVSAFWPLLKWLARSQRRTVYDAAIEVASASVLALGVFWFVSRAYG